MDNIDESDEKKVECDHRLVPMKNKVIDSGYVCVLCGNVYQEYKGIYDANNSDN